MEKEHKIRHRITYTEYLKGPALAGQGSRTVAERTMECEVELTLDVVTALFVMGARACTATGGKCRDGVVTVKRIGKPVQIKSEIPGEGWK